MSFRSDSWCRHLMPRAAKGRVIPRADMIVPFGARLSSSYSDMMLKIVAGAGKKGGASTGLPGMSSASAATVASGVEGSAGTDSGGGGSGDGSDGGGDGDGDGDGPRRKSTARRVSSRPGAARRRSSSPSKSLQNAAHSRALIAFVVVTALLLGTVLAFGLNGQANLAEKVLGAFVSVATVAAALLRPK